MFSLFTLSLILSASAVQMDPETSVSKARIDAMIAEACRMPQNSRLHKDVSELIEHERDASCLWNLLKGQQRDADSECSFPHWNVNDLHKLCHQFEPDSRLGTEIGSVKMMEPDSRTTEIGSEDEASVEEFKPRGPLMGHVEDSITEGNVFDSKCMKEIALCMEMEHTLGHINKKQNLLQKQKSRHLLHSTNRVYGIGEKAWPAKMATMSAGTSSKSNTHYVEKKEAYKKLIGALKPHHYKSGEVPAEILAVHLKEAIESYRHELHNSCH